MPATGSIASFLFRPIAIDYMKTFAKQIAPKHPSGLKRNGPGRQAFTLLELVVVLATITILAAMLMPAFAKTRRTGAGIQCLDNKKQLTLAWLMYSEDNHGALTPNENGGSGSGTGTVDLTKNWANGWLNWIPDNTDNTNLHYLADALLGPYAQRQTRVFKCPADIYTCLEGGRAMPRTRSVSMNGYIEGGAYLAFKWAPNQSIWYGGAYMAYNKISDIVRPPPSNLFVFLDEHPDSINDGWLITDMQESGYWVDLPASYHNRACGFSFADGHAEIHKWLDPVTCQPVRKAQQNGGPYSPTDTAWMQQHASFPYSQR
jgi:prepilin-type processing-associated H-X9-DG protein